jgi:hypothetical protein
MPAISESVNFWCFWHYAKPSQKHQKYLSQTQMLLDYEYLQIEVIRRILPAFTFLGLHNKVI